MFAVAKLLETGLVNLPRIEVLWRPLTNHLLEVCQHPHIRMREWGVEAVTYLVKAALQYKYETPLKDNMVSNGSANAKINSETMRQMANSSFVSDTSSIATESIGRIILRSAW